MARSWNKWSKYKVLRQHADVKSSLPNTKWMNRASFKGMLRKYRRVILKPIQKWGGQGLMLVSKKGRACKVKTGQTSKTFAKCSAAWSYVKRKKVGKSYIVQRFVPLLKIRGRPFDMRVMVQRGGDGEWTVTGKLAKVAGGRHFITNLRRSGGKVIGVKTALARSGLKPGLRKSALHKLDSVSLQCARHLGNAYPEIRTIGLDMAFDRKGKVWFIEGNFTPMISLFKRLRDKSVYQRILSFHKK